MAPASTLLKGRANTHKITDGLYEVRIDGDTAGFVIGDSISGYAWEERPDRLWKKRTEAADMLIRACIERGEVDPDAPPRNLRGEYWKSFRSLGR